MKKARIIAVGMNYIGSTTIAVKMAQIASENVKVQIVENNIEAKNIVNSQFKPEPIILNNYHQKYFELKINDIPRNKFFDKPRNNFKKR